MDQIRNILQQSTGLIYYISTSTNVYLAQIVGVTGTGNSSTDSLLVAYDGINNITRYINICNICALKFLVFEGGFEGQFNYLSEPIPSPTGCEANCEKSLRNTLSGLIDNNNLYDFHTECGDTFNGSIIADVQYGVAILGSGTFINDKSDILISLCKVTEFYLTPD